MHRFFLALTITVGILSPTLAYAQALPQCLDDTDCQPGESCLRDVTIKICRVNADCNTPDEACDGGFCVSFSGTCVPGAGTPAARDTDEPSLESAQSVFAEAGGAAGIASDQNVQTIASNIIRAGLALTGVVLLSLIIYGGALWMTSGGVEKKVIQAKKVIGRAIIGFAIVVTSYAITSFVIESLASI